MMNWSMRKIYVSFKASRKKLLEKFKSYDKTDPQGSAKLRNLKVNKKLSVDDLEQILITSVNLDQLVNELNSSLRVKTNDIQKAVDKLQIELIKKDHNKLSNQLKRIIYDKIDTINTEIKQRDDNTQIKKDR